MQGDHIDTSTESVERLATRLDKSTVRRRDGTGRPMPGYVYESAHVLRALLAERDELRTAHAAAARLAADTADRLGEMRAERDAAIARAEALERDAEAAAEAINETSAYKTAAAGFLASKGLLAEYDAWCESGKLPPDTVGRLIAVARAARRARFDMGDDHYMGAEPMWLLDSALDALPPGILDQSSDGG